MDALPPDQKAYLIEVAGSEERISAIEKRIQNTARRYRRAEVLSLVVGLFVGIAAIGAVANYFMKYHPSVLNSNLAPPLLIILTAYPAISLTAYIGFRSSPEYRTFRALVTCISTVDKAVGKAYASKERKKLASQVLWSARAMRSYRPLVPIRMHKRLMSREAIRASQTLKELVYPAMLGTDRELRDVKRDLARAAISVGTTNWAQVAGVKDITVSRRTNARAVTASLIPLFTILVPLVTALVTAAVAVAPKPSATPAASAPGPNATPSGTRPGPSGTPTGTRAPSPKAGSGH
jgi:hypothetical protein